MTFADLKTQVSVLLDDINNGYFSTSQISAYINNAQKEVQKQLIEAGENYYVICKQTPVVQNQCQYELPSDFLKVHRMELVTGGTYPNENKETLGSITIQQQDLFGAQVAQPQAYFLKKSKIILWPVPDTDYTYLRMSYSYRVADMTLDTEAPDCPEEFQEYIVILAALDGFYRDNRDPSSLLEKKRYYEELLKRMADERTVDSAKNIVVTSDYGSLETIW